MAHLSVGKMYCFNTCCCFLFRYLWIRLRMCEGGEITEIMLLTALYWNIYLLTLSKANKIKKEVISVLEYWLLNETSLCCEINVGVAEAGRECCQPGTPANRAEVKELCRGWSHFAAWKCQQGNPARAPSSLCLLSCTHPQGGRVRRNPSTADMELNWESEKHPTGFIRRAVFNLKKTPCKCRDPSQELSHWFS